MLGMQLLMGLVTVSSLLPHENLPSLSDLTWLYASSALHTNLYLEVRQALFRLIAGKLHLCLPSTSSQHLTYLQLHACLAHRKAGQHLSMSGASEARKHHCCPYILEGQCCKGMHSGVGRRNWNGFNWWSRGAVRRTRGKKRTADLASVK